MRILTLAAAGALLTCTTAISAQTTATTDPAAASKPMPYDRGYDKDDARTRAINDSGRPAVQAANDAVLARSDAQTVGGAVNGAQYEADMAAYRAAVAARKTVIAADRMVYERQQHAYADAMADWRAQVDACRVGNRRVCDLPTPDPANYW